MRKKYKSSFHKLAEQVEQIWIALFGNQDYPKPGHKRKLGLLHHQGQLRNEFDAFRDLVLSGLTQEQLEAFRLRIASKSEVLNVDQSHAGIKLYLDGDLVTFEKLVEFLAKAREGGRNINESTIGIRHEHHPDEIWILKRRSGVSADEKVKVDFTDLHTHSEFSGGVEEKISGKKKRHQQDMMRRETAIHLDKNDREIKVGDEVIAGPGVGHTGTIESFIFYDNDWLEGKGPDRFKEIPVKCVVNYDTYPPQLYEGKVVEDEIKYGIWQYEYLTFKSRAGEVEEETELPVPIAGSPADLPDWEDLVQTPMATLNQSLDLNGVPLEHGDVVQVMDDKGGLGTVEKIYVAAKFGELIKPDSQKTAEVSFDEFGNEQFKSNKRGDFPMLQKVTPR